MRNTTFALSFAAALVFSPVAVRAQAPADPARVAAMLAKFECEQLSTRYAHYFDADEGEKLAELFGDSGRLVLGIAQLKGGKAIAEFAQHRFKEMMSGAFAKERGHHRATPVWGHHTITNYEFDLVDADHAKARAYLTLYMFENNGTGRVDSAAPYMLGVFEDRYARVNGRWQFEERKLQSVTSRFFATAPEPKK
jgi:hypothetical protein